MNNARQILLGLLGCTVLAGMTACSGDDDMTLPIDDGVKVRRLTITQTDDNTATRATLTDGDDGLTAKWTAGDALTYCNLSGINPETEDIYSGGLTAVSTAATSQFTGDVECRKGDYLAVVYPATEFTRNTEYTISLTGQDGTLATLATSYHYVFGKARVTAVTDKTADATIGRMKSLLTVCKFSFVDKSNDAAIPIKTLTVSYGGSGGDAGKYPHTATVSIGVNMAQDDVHATGATATEPLTVTCTTAQEAVYVALLPTNAQRTFSFTVTDGSGKTYSGTAKAKLTEGDYVVATGLKLTQNQ
ncbi:MAG: hypothetical protein IKM76_11350 [Prevotella sp.]|nr:hypothetical protein [Prevotella sp.]MBR6828725.1 hypothetical protein [Prevotella sp.]